VAYAGHRQEGHTVDLLGSRYRSHSAIRVPLRGLGAAYLRGRFGAVGGPWGQQWGIATSSSRGGDPLPK
jgi:hypothetical protein